MKEFKIKINRYNSINFNKINLSKISNCLNLSFVIKY